MNKLRLLALTGCGLGVIALLGLLLAGPGYRLDVWHYRVSFKIMEYAAYLGIAAALLSLIGLVLAHRNTSGLLLGALGLVIGGFCAWLPWHLLQTAKGVPPIHDISSDTQHPPEFIAVLPLRKDAPNSAVYEGAALAAQQQAAYPDLQPLLLEVPPAEAFERALHAARGLGWEIVAAEPAMGRIEATDTTFWFGFKDDVVVRIAPAQTGSRIDVRSVSRAGKSDVGANAARIRRYLAALQK